MKKMLCWVSVLAMSILATSLATAGSTIGVGWLIHQSCSYGTPASLSSNATYRIQHDDSYYAGGILHTDFTSTSNIAIASGDVYYLSFADENHPEGVWEYINSDVEINYNWDISQDVSEDNEHNGVIDSTAEEDDMAVSACNQFVPFDAVLVKTLYPNTHFQSRNCYTVNYSGPAAIAFFSEDMVDGGTLAHWIGTQLGILDNAEPHDITYQYQGVWAGTPPSFAYATRNVLSNSTDQYLFNVGW